MAELKIIFGTESGNAEMVADELAGALNAGGMPAEALGMDVYPVTELAAEDLVVLITSTYGEGDLPLTTAPFYAALAEARPDLSGLTFAAFGLGDSSYATYNNAIRTLTDLAAELGARQLGATGLHDADSGLDPATVAIDWAQTTFQLALAG